MVYFTTVSAFDGQRLQLTNGHSFELSAFLGSGSSGHVYEASTGTAGGICACKILNAFGMRLTPPSQLARFRVLRAGMPLSAAQELGLRNARAAAALTPPAPPLAGAAPSSPRASPVDNTAPLREENVWWVASSNGEPLAAFADPAAGGALRELGVMTSAQIWGWPELDPQHTPTGHGGTPTVGVVGANGGLPSLPRKYAAFLRARESVFREIAVMAALSSGPGAPHANVLALYGVAEQLSESSVKVFLLLELAAGGEVFDRIRVDTGCPDEGAAARFMSQLLAGVSFCHARGVSHRDLKPENLLIADTPAGPLLKIADFGLSTLPRGGAGGPLPRVFSVVGSAFYIAPEIFGAPGSVPNGSEGYDGAKADAYSCGVILYALLCGALPFDSNLNVCGRWRSWVAFCESRDAESPARRSGRRPPSSVLHFRRTSAAHCDAQGRSSASVVVPDVSGDAQLAAALQDKLDRELDEEIESMRVANDALWSPGSRVLLRQSRRGLPVRHRGTCTGVGEEQWGSGESFSSSSGGHASDSMPAHPTRKPMRRYPDWLFPPHVPEGARVLLSKLLHPRPEARVSVRVAARSAWLRKTKDAADTSIPVIQDASVTAPPASAQPNARAPPQSPPLAPFELRERLRLSRGGMDVAIDALDGFSLDAGGGATPVATPESSLNSPGGSVGGSSEGCGPAPSLFASTVRRATRFVTELPAEVTLKLIARALEATPKPFGPPFSSVRQTVRIDAEKFTAHVYWGGVLAAQARVFALAEVDGTTVRAGVAADASPLLRPTAAPQAAPEPTSSLSQFLIEFTRGPSVDFFRFAKLFKTVRDEVARAAAEA